MTPTPQPARRGGGSAGLGPLFEKKGLGKAKSGGTTLPLTVEADEKPIAEDPVPAPAPSAESAQEVEQAPADAPAPEPEVAEQHPVQDMVTEPARQPAPQPAAAPAYAYPPPRSAQGYAQVGYPQATAYYMQPGQQYQAQAVPQSGQQFQPQMMPQPPVQYAPPATAPEQKPVKEKTTKKASYYEPIELGKRMRRAYNATKYVEGHDSLSDFIVRLIEQECQRLEDLYNDGKPFEGDNAVPKGRPVRP